MELWSSPLQADRESAKELYSDWNSARGRILTEITAKLSNYAQLPWRLLALAHHDHVVALTAAKDCLSLWKQGGTGCKHRQSRRFCDPSYRSGSLSADPPLQPLLVRMALGQPITGDEFKPLRVWLAKFQVIKLAERSVEGAHAIITKTLRRAPAAGLGYISTELRFHTMWNQLCGDPKAPWAMVHDGNVWILLLDSGFWITIDYWLLYFVLLCRTLSLVICHCHLSRWLLEAIAWLAQHMYGIETLAGFRAAVM